MLINEKLREICNKEGVTLKKMAELSGISYGQMKHYAAGRNTPSHQRLLQIVNVPQFKKYTPFLLSIDDDPEYFNKSSPADLDTELSVLFDLVCEAGYESEARQYLQYLAARGKKL